MLTDGIKTSIILHYYAEIGCFVKENDLTNDSCTFDGESQQLLRGFFFYYYTKAGSTARTRSDGASRWKPMHKKEGTGDARACTNTTKQTAQ